MNHEDLKRAKELKAMMDASGVGDDVGYAFARLGLKVGGMVDHIPEFEGARDARDQAIFENGFTVAVALVCGFIAKEIGILEAVNNDFKKHEDL